MRTGCLCVLVFVGHSCYFLWSRFNRSVLFHAGSSSDAGGFANVEFSPGSSVEGCVYTLTDAELSMLDNCMGYPKVFYTG